MADAGRSELPRRAALGAVATWQRLNFEQRVAGIGALLLVVSTFGPFSFVEAAIVLIGLAVLFLLRRRAEGREFHIPFGDGTVIAAAGAWSALLIFIRLFDRPLGQNLLALVCAAILLVAGVAERRKRPADDLAVRDPEAHQRDADAVAVAWEEAPPRSRRSRSATPVYGNPVPGEEDTSPLGERRPRVGGSDASTEVRGRRRRRGPSEPEPPAPEAAAGSASGADSQLELTPEPPPGTPSEPLPPPEFHLPGEDDDAGPPPPPPPPRPPAAT